MIDLDGFTCVEHCSVEAYPDHSSTCQPCNNSCLEFSQDVYAVSFSEATPLDAVIVTVSVEDRRALGRPVEFVITAGNEAREFEIEQDSGIISLARILDYELQTAHTFVVTAFDVGMDPISSQSASATVLILLEDANDNPPVFLGEPYTASVLENLPGGVSLLTVQATDADSPSNAMVTYSLASGNSSGIFNLYSVSGEVSTLVPLDFENQSIYTLNVMATDSGSPPLSSSTIVTVLVMDENDVRPTLDQTSYSLSLSELTPVSTSLLQLQAQDPDTTNITYKITGGNTGGVFQLDPTTGLLSVALSLDYETVQEYALTVVATDGLPNPLTSGTASVRIALQDENDNSPMFNQTSYSASIEENSPLASFVISTPAADLDSGNNSLLLYSIAEADAAAVFTVDARGDIFTVSALDFEARSMYTFTVIATDQGNPALSSSAAVTVSVTDVNDNPPIFSEERLMANLTEDHPIGSVIATFQASDNDSGSNAALLYQFVNSTPVPFSIDPLHGDVILIQTLDYEEVAEYEVTVVVSDAGSPPRSAMATLSVFVMDVNDNAPQFSVSEYTAAVPESLVVGSSVTQVRATDADSGVNAAITYRIAAGNQDGVFTIDEQTGEISLAASLDFEQQPLHVIIVSATNDLSVVPLGATVTVQIAVSETNEHPPIFTQDTYRADLFENEPNGTFVTQLGASDLDSGPSGEIAFEIVDGALDIFEVDGSSGVIRTLRSVDRERQTSYTLTVQAIDGGIPSFSATATVEVTVIDRNDNPPRFSITTPYVATLTENAPPGTDVMTTPPLMATDVDSVGRNSEVTYAIVGGDPNGLFAIGSLTGQLQSNGGVDYESVQGFALIVSATDQGDQPLSSLATIQVEILDQNDNQPSITNVSTTLVFTEGQGQLLVCPVILVSDPDSLPLQRITISLSGQSGDSLSLPSVPPGTQISPQTIEITGQLSTSEATAFLQTLTLVNSETEPSSSGRQVEIVVFDGTFSDTASIEIIFSLINDNAPTVDLDTSSPGTNYEAVFVEESPPVSLTGTTVLISDSDSEASGLASLIVELINPLDGDLEGISVSRPPNPELEVVYGSGNHSLTISASSEAPFAAFEAVLSTLTYFNLANEPRASLAREVRVTAFDGALESVSPAIARVEVVLVNDPPLLDLGQQSDFQVEFIEGRGPVGVVSSTAFSLTDSDSALLANATVILFSAPDGRNESLGIQGGSSVVSDNITVTQTPFSIALEGPASLGEFATVLAAITYDNTLASPSPEQRLVEFTVSDGHAVSTATTFVTFSLVNDPPVLDLNGPETGLDFQADFFEGSPPIFLTSPDVSIRDVDSPSIHSALVLLMPPPSDMESEGLQIDLSQLNPSLMVDSSPTVVAIEGEAGLGSYATALAAIAYFNDAEEPVPGVRLVTFTISDGTNSSASTTAITVTLVNDPPMLTVNEGQVFTTTYTEESTSVAVVSPGGIILSDNDNTSLAYVLVTLQNLQDGPAEILGFVDPSTDSSLSATQNDISAELRTYTLTFSEESSSFENFRSLISSLSYRSTSLEPTAGVREISIAVSDGLVMSSPPQISLVNITLLNDNAPQFQQLFFTASVPENRVGVEVVTLRASDADSDTGAFADQGIVIYDIIGGDEAGFFAVDPLSGVITLLQPKDREITTAGAVLTVQATNPLPLDNPLMFYPTAFVVVSITDENDNAPVFVNETYEFQVFEDAQFEHVVGSVAATDADVGDNGRITYTISQGNINSVFQIDPASGEITVADENFLDRELVASYLLSVTAVDNGQPAISNSTVVTIEILDVNDNPPVFAESLYTAFLTEFSPTGSQVVNVSATDPDSESTIAYSIEGTLSFAVDATTGEVTSSQLLDYESQSFHNFTVVATDGELSSSARVLVSVLDENDHQPVFLEASYNTSVLENLPIGQPVLIVTAVDGDDGSNAEITYFINETVPFAIDPTSGVVNIASSLDREETALYEFNVTARDKGQPSLRSSVPVKILITDVNDNPPAFPQREYTAEIPENLDLLTVVATVTATDADSGSNGRVVYSLGGGAGVFQIDPLLGELFTTAEVDREEQNTYQLEITASDSASPSLSTTVTMFVNITDINDNAPTFVTLAYQFTVTENTPAGPFGSVFAADSDVNENAMVTYSLPTGAPSPFFVDEVNGQLFTFVPFDRESTASYVFTVLATDSGQPPLSSNATVTVIVEDANDFAPAFSESTYNLTVPEDEPLTMSLLSLTATDLDAGTNADIMYEILPGGTEGVSSVFVLDSQTGQLQLVSSLDAETTVFYSFIVEARDGGSTQLFSTALVAITVTDVNDNPVQLSLGSSLTVAYTEESPPVAIATDVTVADDDVSTTVVNATVELVGSRTCCEDQLVFPVEGGQFPELSHQLMNNNQLLFIEGPAAASVFTSALRNVQYVNTNPEPVEGSLISRFTVSDGTFSAVEDLTIEIVPVNDNAPTVLLDGTNTNSSITFTENSPGVGVTGSGVTISDADSNAVGLESVSVTLLTAVDGSSLEFLTLSLGGDLGSISVFPTSGQSLTLSGPANFSDFVAAISAIRYHNLAENPQLPLQRLIEVVPNDGDNVGVSSFAVVTVVPINDPPYLQLGAVSVNHTTEFTEGGDPIALASSNLIVSDPDSQLLTSAMVAILNVIDVGNEHLFQSTGSSVLTVNRLSLTSLEIIGPATIPEFSSALQEILYSNNATDPSPATKLVQFSVSDGELSAVAYTEVSVLPVNDPPVLDLNGPLVLGTGVEVEFTEGGPPVSLLSDQLLVEDSDDELLASVTVTILPPRDGTAESFLVSPQGGISATFSPDVGSLSLSGLASLSDYRSTLLTLQYLNSADEPSGGQRQVQFTASDGLLESEPAIATVTFVLVNDPPVIILDAGGDFSTFYEENGPPVPLVNLRSAEIADPDSPNLSYLFIRIENAFDGELELVNYSSPVEGLIEDIQVAPESHSQYYNLSYSIPMPINVFANILLSLSYQNLASEPNASLPRVVSISTNDGEQNSAVAVAMVTINLKDDNQPTFAMDSYVFELSEDASPGSEVGVVLATDADLGDTFLYQLSPMDSPFAINSLTGVISLQDSVDRETQSIFNLTVQLTRDLPPFSIFDSEAAVTITLRDVNDNTPVFNASSFSFSIAEDTTTGTTIATLTAADADQGTNSELTYSLSGTAMFSIDPLTGAVFVSQTLDRETVPSIEFVVSVLDAGLPQLSSQAGVTVLLLDVNDNSPVFSPSMYFTQLVETVALDTSVLQVSASDRDSGSNAEIRYSLSPASPQFSLNSSTGVLTTATSLTPDDYLFTVTATDSGSPPLSSDANLTIQVISFNSTLPVFSQPAYEGTVLENAGNGTVVLTVAASDPILSSPVRYSIATEGVDEFLLHPLTGILSTNALLDRELQDMYQFQVTAISDDGTREGVARVVVHLLDVNDFAPEFLQSTYTFISEENAPLGSTIGAVLARDTFDIGSNSQIVSYTISSDNFTISSLGIISTAVGLDREVQDVFTFEAFAVDGGDPPLSGTSTVVVQVLDVNDNAPEFSRTIYEASIEEGEDTERSVTTVLASDLDEGSSADISFTTNSTAFSVNAQTGQVVTLVALDFETTDFYEVVVVAVDHGQPRLSSSATVRITVLDIDDTPPQFTMATYMGSVLEEQSSTSVLTVVAFDPDSDSENPIVYDIIASNDDIMSLFAINQMGNISTLLPLNRENTSQYSFIVRASNLDFTGSTLSSTAMVFVEVSDINDHAPSFLGEPYFFEISEDIGNATVVGTLPVTDLDVGDNARISTFEIISGNSHGNFVIDPQSGTLRVAESAVLDRETVDMFSVGVRVTDAGDPPLSADAIVDIRLTDVNDNPPMFDQDEYNVTLREDTAVAIVILSPVVTDADLGANANVTFSLVQSDDSTFSIDPDTGMHGNGIMFADP